jgi:FkbM family methyltransferase
MYYKLKMLFGLIKYRGFFLKNQYSKNKEDQYLKKIFKNKINGFYIDIGAYHPYRFSNTFHLYKKGWHGINVDINKESIDLFNISRPRDKNLNIAISNENKIKKFFYKKKKHPMNTLNKDFAKTYFKEDGRTIRKENIMCKKFDHLMKIAGRKKIDLLDIDVEGDEYNIIKHIDFKKNFFNIILIELSHFNKTAKRNSKKIKQILLKNNYFYVKHCGETSIFKNRLY